ncbi:MULTISPECIES: TetR/AcrR family transcriptional regulator [Intestinimonas]|uniref:TetR/AcrR family transcriptional regulator n=1 Tax=Intestinimonas TaxID=1392389 RepID=UPI00067F1440|nr:MULTISPECIES: TetR/AcrR family transcriptional regulator [Intestinimonas]MCI5561678.1 TetR/AcrR family transcriptional regulator [Intestinimonas massiliensis (ex Afouda et al. 2020)]MDY5340151.1 TetR/AcrR family transcriptional regulator [Intestinimonas sp.]
MSYAQRRQAQARQTERNILQAALTLMRERGFDKVSIRDICKQAGITTGAFYHHFPSKESLLNKGFAPLDDYMEAALRGHEADEPAERLGHILSAYARFMEEEGGELTGRYYVRRITDPTTQSMDSSRYTLRAMVECFRQAQREGILASGRSPEWVADFCYRHFRGVVIDWVLHNYSYRLLPKMEEDYQLFTGFFQKTAAKERT